MITAMKKLFSIIFLCCFIACTTNYKIQKTKWIGSYFHEKMELEFSKNEFTITTKQDDEITSVVKGQYVLDNDKLTLVCLKEINNDENETLGLTLNGTVVRNKTIIIHEIFGQIVPVPLTFIKQ